MTRPRYLPTPLCELMRRDLPDLPWQPPDCDDPTSPAAWVAGIDAAVCVLGDGRVLRAQRNAHDRIGLLAGDSTSAYDWSWGRTARRAFDRWSASWTRAGALSVPSAYPWGLDGFDLTLFGGASLCVLLLPVGLGIASIYQHGQNLANTLAVLLGLTVILAIVGLAIARALQSHAAHDARRALVIAEVMRRPLPWLAGPSATEGALSFPSTTTERR